MPAPWGLARALCAKVQKTTRLVPHLREQKAAPIANVGIVIAELVAVITQREWLGQVVG